MKNIAHRGSSAKYPENTLLAFRKALEAGADGIETDLRLTRDEKIILFHDDSLKRLTGVDARPERLTLDALKKLDAGQGEEIPTLDELLVLIHGNITLILEIKYDPKTYKKLCEILVKKIEDKLSWVEASCFDDAVLAYVYKLNPGIKLHKLVDDASLLESKDFEVKYADVRYFDIDIQLREIVWEKGLIERYKVIYWTVENEDLAKEEKAGLYGVMKNDVGGHRFISLS